MPLPSANRPWVSMALTTNDLLSLAWIHSLPKLLLLMGFMGHQAPPSRSRLSLCVGVAWRVDG